jgi:hypothetical protein
MNSQFPPELSNKRDENEEDDKHGPPFSNIGSNVKINAKKEKILSSLDKNHFAVVCFDHLLLFVCFLLLDV